MITVHVMFAGFFKLLRVLLLSAGALLCVITFTPVVRWAAAPLGSHWTNVDHGVLIVLSGTTVALPGPPPNLVIGGNTYWRVIHAIAVWRSGHFSKMLLSGEGMAESVKPVLVASGIPESAILVENAAASTHQNALFSKPILAGLPGPYVLITSDYHMYRASRCFAHENIAVETMPAPDLYKRCDSLVERWPLFWELGTEFAAIGYYRWRGWM